MADNKINIDSSEVKGYSNNIRSVNNGLSSLKFASSVDRTTLSATSNAEKALQESETGNNGCYNTVDHFVSQVDKMTDNYMAFDEEIGNTYR